MALLDDITTSVDAAATGGHIARLMHVMESASRCSATQALMERGDRWSVFACNEGVKNGLVSAMLRRGKLEEAALENELRTLMRDDPELARLNGIGLSRSENGKAIQAHATYLGTNWAAIFVEIGLHHISDDHISNDHISGGHIARLTRLTIEYSRKVEAVSNHTVMRAKAVFSGVRDVALQTAAVRLLASHWALLGWIDRNNENPEAPKYNGAATKSASAAKVANIKRLVADFDRMILAHDFVFIDKGALTASWLPRDAAP